MGKSHPFYRFQPAWNAGFYPDNQIISNLLNDIQTYIAGWLPGFYTGKTIIELKAAVKDIVDQYNAFPYFGGLEIVATTAPDPPFMDYYIYIRNQDLYVIDNNQQLLITGQYNASTLVIATATLTSFTPGSYTGNFDPSPIPVEAEVANALTIANQYGSAFFPLTYSYDSNTNIAKSGLARGVDWTFNSSNEPVRLPAPTLPLQNARRFSLEPLDANDKFIVSVIDRVIASSLANPDYLAIQATLNSFTMPDGWSTVWTYDSTAYERIQIDFVDSDNFKVFTMVGRRDVDWLWQRFINPNTATTSAFLTPYSAYAPLPYLPLSASSYLYFDAFYELDFVDFNSGCYVSPEFYAMPAIPGDQWQFNVPIDDGNITGLTSVSVGLFQEDGGFIQKIGTAYKESDCFSQVYASATIPAVATGCYRLGLYGEAFSPCNMTFTTQITSEDYGVWIAQVNDAFGSLNPYLSFSIQGSGSPTYYIYTIPDASQTQYTIAEWVNTNIPGMTATADSLGIYFTWQVNDLPCGNTYTFTNCIGDVDGTCIITLWQGDPQECVCNSSPLLFSLSNIINIDASDCFSTMLEFWSDNDSIAEGFEYTANWKQKVRLGLNGGGAKPVIEENLYRQSNGVHKRPQNKQDLSVDLHTDFLDEETQLALVDATRHPYLVWNQKPIFVKGDLEVATIQDYTTQSSFETLAQVKFQALIQGFQPKNSSCLTC